jgi:basic membrane protein A
LATLAQTRVTRSLASDECQKYLHLDQTACAPVAPIATAPILPPTAKNRVCQVAEPGGLQDVFYGELIYQGTQDAAEKFGWDTTALESDDLQKTIQKFVDADCDLIVGWSFGLADATRVAAEANPTQKFQIMDVVEGPPLAEVWAQTYATDQAAFLAGYVAASVTKTGKVGTFGGIGISPITDFMDGFALGVAYYNKKHGTSVEVLGWDVQTRAGLFVGGFCCSAEGRQMAVRLLNDGADIILSVAGPSVDAGAAAEVQEHSGVYFIGVDADWAINSPDYANIVLTSIEKHLDLSVVLAVQAVVEGTFKGGAHIGTLATDEVSLSPFHELDGLVSPQIKADLEQITADIIAGNIRTKP